MREVGSPTCLYCGAEKDDAVRHIAHESMVQVMLDKHENWALVSRFAGEILRTKKGDLDKQTNSGDQSGLPP